MSARYSLPPFDWLTTVTPLGLRGINITSGYGVTVTIYRLHFLKLDREFFCMLPSLARLYSAAAWPSSRLRSDGSLATTLQQHSLFALPPWTKEQPKSFFLERRNLLRAFGRSFKPQTVFLMINGLFGDNLPPSDVSPDQSLQH